MKVAIVYYSLTGNVQWVVDAMGSALSADKVRLVPKKEYPDKGFKKFFWGGKSAVMKETPTLEPYTFDPDQYNIVVLATPVWAGTFAPPLRTFLQQYGASIATKAVSALLCCSGGEGKAKEKLRTALGIADFAQSLVLVDPKDKPDPANDQRIAGFCRAIQG